MDFISRDAVSYSVAAPGLCAAMGDARRMRAVVLALCVLGLGVLGSPVLAALLLGVVTASVVRGAPSWWQVLSLILLVLFPGQLWGVAAFLPVLFWPWLASEKATTRAALSREGSIAPCVAVVAALLVWRGAASAPLLAVLCCCGMAVVLAARTVKGTATDFSAAGMVRPALLVALAAAARHEGLDLAGQGAIIAAILDLAVQWLRSWPMKYLAVASLLAAPFPPMPGFFVVWVGVHTAFDLASGAPGWAVPAMLCALIFGVLAVLDFWHVGQGVRKTARISTVEIGKAVIVLIVLMVGLVLAQHYVLGGENVPFASFGGGDGAFIHIGAMALFLGVVFWICVRRRDGGAFLGYGLIFPRGDILPLRKHGVPWVWRRYLVVMRKAVQDARLLGGRGGLRLSLMEPALREGGASLGWWLAVLAIILAVLGAQA